MDFHCATSTMREKSPVIDNRKVKHKNMIAPGEEKVHRLILNSECRATFVSAVSPSCIWIRLPNQNGDVCDLYERYNMTRFYLPEVHRYCMAPRLVESETGVVVVYSRGRILKLHGEEGQGQLAYVHFIDHGFGNWVYVAALATLPYGMCAIPWQAIPVALMGARPQGSFLKPVSEEDLWTDKHCKLINEILGRFDEFIIKPVLNKSNKLTYRDYARVQMFGVIRKEEEKDTDDKDNLDQSGRNEYEELDKPEEKKNKIDEELLQSYDVLRLFVKECIGDTPLTLSFEIDELSEQPLFGTVSEREIVSLEHAQFVPELQSFPDEKRIASPIRRDIDLFDVHDFDKPYVVECRSPETCKKFYNLGDTLTKRELWDLEKFDSALHKKMTTFTHQIPHLDVSHLIMSEVDGTKWLILAIDSISRFSAHCFYGFPIPSPPSRNVTDCYVAIQEFYNQLEEWKNHLNGFYFLVENCHVLNFEHVKEVIKRKQRVYAIYCRTDLADNHMFTRVQVLEVKDDDLMREHVHITFLDSGGTKWVPAGTLLRVHSQHATRPPMCVPLAMTKICPVTGEEWSPAECEKFRQYCIVDTPLKCQLIEAVNDTTSDGVVMPTAFHITELGPAFTSNRSSIEDRLVKAYVARYR